MLHDNTKEIIESSINSISSDSKIFIERNLAISKAIAERLLIINKDLKWLCYRSKISKRILEKILTGNYDVTFRQISKIEDALQVDILKVV